MFVHNEPIWTFDYTKGLFNATIMTYSFLFKKLDRQPASYPCSSPTHPYRRREISSTGDWKFYKRLVEGNERKSAHNKWNCSSLLVLHVREHSRKVTRTISVFCDVRAFGYILPERCDQRSLIMETESPKPATLRLQNAAYVPACCIAPLPLLPSQHYNPLGSLTCSFPEALST